MPHYFENSDSHRSGKEVKLPVGDRKLTLQTSGGVFAKDGIDLGTRVLLEVVPPPSQTGDLLDVGCGYGPIALTMAVLAPQATVWAIDVNEQARQMCQLNAVNAKLDNVIVRGPDEMSTGKRFATIWSNPPIRIGKTALHELLTRWLSQLASDGEAYLVVQRNLGSDSLQSWLIGEGWPTERIASKKGYRVLRCGARR